MGLKLYATTLTLLSVVRKNDDAKFCNYNQDGTANEVFVMSYAKFVELGEPGTIRIALACDDEENLEITLTKEGQFEDHAKLVDEITAIPDPED